MRIVCTADLQAQCFKIKPHMLPEGDVLIVAGDIGGWGSVDDMEDFNEWLESLPYKHKVVVAGNHDISLQEIDGHEVLKNATYLENEYVEIEGIKIFGSPVSDMNNLYHRTPFNAFASVGYIIASVGQIPDNLDILITHGPAYGLLDKTAYGECVGSKELRDAVLFRKPKYHVFGHIHEDYGTKEYNGTTFINAAMCSRMNQIVKYDESGELVPYNEPIVIEI